VTLRGLGGNASSRALVVLDGVPQMDPFGGWISWTGLDASAAASAVVISGGGFARQGPGAIAGVIELFSARANIGSTGDRMAFGVHGGSFGAVGVRTDGLVDVGGIIVQFAGEAERSDGFAPIVATQRGAADGRAPYQQRGGSLRLLRALADTVELQANVRSWNDQRNRGTAFSDNSNSGTDASVRIVGVGPVEWSLLGYFQDRNFASQFASISADRSIVSPVLDQYAVPATGWGGRGEIGFEPFSNGHLKIGTDWRRTEGETRENFFFTGGVPGRNRIAGGRTGIFGGFAELDIEPVYRLQFAVSGRVDRWQIENGFRREVNIGGSVRSDDHFVDRKGTEPTARAAFDWKFFENGIVDEAHFRGSAFTAWRLPTLNELYRPFRVGNDATAANDALSPERVRGAELGVNWRKGDVSLSVTGFANRLKDAIANVTLGQGPGNFPGVGFVVAGGTYRQRRNLDAILSRGVELDASLALSNETRVSVGYAFVDTKVRASGSAALLDGLRPAQVPRHFGRVTLAHEGDKLSADATLRYIGKQYEDDSNSRVLDEALTADVRLSYAVDHNLRVELRGENVFDARVEAAISGTGIIERANPRTLWLGLSWKVD
jgi:vitamin B12 transporter